jgi:hypothetical protein
MLGAVDHLVLFIIQTLLAILKSKEVKCTEPSASVSVPCPSHFKIFQFSVYSGEVSAHLTLAQYLREHLGLTGTKITCAQAGKVGQWR